MAWICGQINKWIDIANNQWLSFRDAQNSPAAKIVPLPNSDEFMTKLEAIEHLGVSPASLSGLANNQFITKSDIVASTRATAWRGINSYCILDRIVTYYNAAYSKNFVRDNCTFGSPSTVPYIVPANTFSSTSSQADADNQAVHAGEVNGQAYANSNGTCKIYRYYNNAVSGQFIKNNCGSTYNGSTITVEVPAMMFGSDDSPFVANNMAQLYLSEIGQTTANAQGTCAPKNSNKPLLMYEGFSPNGDGRNDTYFIGNIEYYNAIVTIYNRDGQQVYSSNNNSVDPWNGRVNNTGNFVPTDSYVVLIVIEGQANKRYTIYVAY